ncbi:nicotinamide mononucleotide transporter [Neolewinella xylanilytica]|uniref:Nicotinamide riboside transporter PnuC n=1 Tax=Neolewinella xylanilytica TaxID=1514080 RepID=A0A2S6I8I7_9BACT|nr:nicotinamide riboside transporter PnuC [Neolewinella xylanilytica]PPK87789.1 nicotinamide mononucleotide transporter [Neolewinella xylanilytica]
MEEFLRQAAATDTVEWLATLTALAYVWLAARDNNWCWLFAAVSAALWAHQSFVVYRLVSDALLQLFYLVMAGVGIYRWQRTALAPAKETTLDELAITERPAPGSGIVRMTLREHLLTIGGGIIGGLFLGAVVGSLTTATSTYADAITTTLSVIATFLLIGRRLENWLYFVVIDAAYVLIYLRSSALLFAALMVLYVVMAIYGYRNWRGLLAVDRGYDAAA